MSSSTRKKDDIFLLGCRDLEPLLRLNQLPTLRQVLLRYHQILNVTKNVKDSAQVVIQEVIEVWNKSGIPTRQQNHCNEKLIKIHQNWLLLKKNKTRASEAQKKRENSFTADLDKLFDIAHSNALNLIKIAEDRDFLIDQRDERKMIMTSVDKKLEKSKERSLKRKHRAEELRKKAAENNSATLVVSSQEISLDSSFSSNSSAASIAKEQRNEEFVATLQKKAQNNTSASDSSQPSTSTSTNSSIFTKHVTGALDRNKITDREAVRLIIPLSAALGCNPASLSISRSTIRRARKKARQEFNENLNETFKPSYPLVIHWDGKILPDITSNKKVDRLPILVSGNGTEKLLSVPKLTAETGENTSAAVYNAMEQWNVTNQVRAMSFDTTASNTGAKNGSCALLEAKTGRDLLWLACRHHLFEIMLSKIFTICFGPSSSPEIPLFKRFRDAWGTFSLDHYDCLDFRSSTEQFVEHTLGSLTAALSGEKQVRDDYNELIELTMIVLNKPPERIHWRSPGPIHRARWIAKLLYAIKIFLFRCNSNIFKLTKREEKQIIRFVTFGALIYSKIWIEAPLAADAPINDLQLWKRLKSYEVIDAEISAAAREVLERHLWYLSDELVAFALFSDKVSCDEKVGIIQKMNAAGGCRSVRGDSSKLSIRATLGVFASERTLRTLTVLDIKDSFLQLPPETWGENNDYVQGKTCIKNLRVVNDTAERGVKLFEDYNNILSKNEEEKQFILHVVEQNRKIISTETSKKDLTNIVLG